MGAKTLRSNHDERQPTGRLSGATYDSSKDFERHRISTHGDRRESSNGRTAASATQTRRCGRRSRGRPAVARIRTLSTDSFAGRPQECGSSCDRACNPSKEPQCVTAHADEMTITPHGAIYSHFDAASHFFYKGRMHNGVPRTEVTERGTARLSGGPRVFGRVHVVCSLILLD